MFRRNDRVKTTNPKWGVEGRVCFGGQDMTGRMLWVCQTDANEIFVVPTGGIKIIATVLPITEEKKD